MNLATESRLAPMNTPEFLDVAKLTARILLLPDFHSYIFTDERNLVEELTSARDGITDRTGEPSVERNGNRLVFYFRDKEILDDKKTVLVPCSIQDGGFNSGENAPRWYIACIKRSDDNKIDCSMESFDRRNIRTILENPDMRALLAKKEMLIEDKESIARFVEQENKTDEIIADAIWYRNETRFDAKSTAILTIENFLKHLGNNRLMEEFTRLAENKQIMYVPGLKKPHAGGVGIYLVNESEFKKNHRDQIVHALFAKCGLLHEENDLMVEVFNKWLIAAYAHDLSTSPWKLKVDDTNKSHIERMCADVGNKQLFEKAKNASFENRWKDPYKIDYYGDNQKEVLTTIIKEFLESKIPGMGEVETVSFETLKEKSGATYKEISYLLPELCRGKLFRTVRYIGKDGIQIAQSAGTYPDADDTVKKRIILDAKSRWKCELEIALKELLTKERAEEYLRKKTEPGKFSMIFLSEWQKETESLDPKDALNLLYSLCTGLNSEYRMDSYFGKDHLFSGSLPHFVLYRYNKEEFYDVENKKEIIQRSLEEIFKLYLSGQKGSLLLELKDFETTRGIPNYLTKKEIADLLPEVCFADGSEFVLGDLFKSSATVRINNYAKDVKEQRALSISEKVGMKAKWRVSLREALGVVVPGRMRAESLSENSMERRDKTKKKISLYEDLDRTTQIDTASRTIKAILSVQDESPVFFMPLELTNAERCQALTKEYAGAKFVPFNQSNLSNLDSQLEKYPARRKVVVTIGADYEEIKDVYGKHENLMPLNFSRGNIEETLNMSMRDTRRKELEKTVISIALLTGVLPIGIKLRNQKLFVRL